jgi:hypothetical protein
MILSTFLHQNHFCDIKTIDSFHLFNDTSEIIFHHMKISLNIIAKKCKTDFDDDFDIDLNDVRTS